MSDAEDPVLALLEQLAGGASFEEARDHCGLDEGTARSLLSQLVDRVRRQGSSRRATTSAAESGFPPPPAESPYERGAVVVAHADGASRGNPGPASYGCVYLGPDGEPAFGEGATIGVATNNVAEYRGCLAALERLRDWGVERAVLRLDSQLVVRQLDGQYRVKDPTLKRWYEKVQAVAGAFREVRFEHVPRKDNAAADRMANLALDAAAKS